MGSMLQAIAPIVTSLIVIAALAMLWRRSRSVWLIVAIAGELIGLLFRAAISILPDLARNPMLFSLWMLAALVFASGLLAYAIETNQRPGQ